MDSKMNHPECLLTDHCNPLRVRLGCRFVGVVLGDDGILDVELEGASPLIISWIDASSASTRCDICITARIYETIYEKRCTTRQRGHGNALRSMTCEDMSSNFVSSCSSSVSTCNVIQSCRRWNFFKRGRGSRVQNVRML